MSIGFYPRLALTNIGKNKAIYLPYLLAASIAVGLFYILSSVTQMVSVSEMSGGAVMSSILMMSSGLCGFFALCILFYINSFVMKRRRKEFGLYSILGMERRHIAVVMVWEVLLTGVASLFCGIVGGALFSQLMFLLLLKIVGMPAQLTFQIPMDAVGVTLILFGVGFALVLLYDWIGLARTDPISLLHSVKEGEREPKARWLLALAGIIALGGGYGMAIAVKTPSDALGAFFLAVLLVIVGTYCLFIAGSIVLLKLMRRNKGFYYQPHNFVAVSGMMYRMKQNAAGLASICILSTCVLVTLSSSVCLFLGEEDILKVRFPRQVMVSYTAQTPAPAQMVERMDAMAQARGLAVEDEQGYWIFGFVAKRNGDTFSMRQRDAGDSYAVNCLALDDYNRITGGQETLGEGEALFYLFGDRLAGDGLRLGEQSYQLRPIPGPEFLGDLDTSPGLVLVLPSGGEVEQVARSYDALGNSHTPALTYAYQFNLEGPEAEKLSFLEEAHALLRPGEGVRLGYMNSEITARQDFYQLYGSILFVGLFFVALFLIATVMIIYYKQITEGFDDRERFQIMEKVGMSAKEVRATITRQVLMVFFLPLGMAVVHIAVAFRVLCKLLSVFAMTNTLLFLGCTAGTVLLFAVLYAFVYHWTARTYYRIVQV